MLGTPDLADLIDLAERHGGKVIVAGDTEQLQAVNNGGGMSLLADRLGYVRLAEPVRFRAAWERAASLRLRDGDATVARRIRPARPDQRRGPGADDRGRRRRLHRPGRQRHRRAADRRRPRPAPGAVAPRPGEPAPPRPGRRHPDRDHRRRRGGGPRRPDHVHPQRPPCRGRGAGRTLANGDLLRIDAITTEGLLVRRALGADRQSGRRRWTDRQFLYAHYQDAELGYAVTAHVAQGRTVRAGLAVFTGSEDRQHAYVALTRGTDDNTAYVFTTPTKLSDPAPGARPAPELARYDRLTAQAGGPAPGDPDDPGRPAR